MNLIEHSQSLAEFRDTPDITIERLNRSGDAEIITKDGSRCAVLLSPALYDEMARAWEVAQDVAAIRRAMQEFDEGKSVSVAEGFDAIHAKLMAMQATGK